MKSSLTKLINKVNNDDRLQQNALIDFHNECCTKFSQIKVKQDNLLASLSEEEFELFSEDVAEYQYNTQIKISALQGRITPVAPVNTVTVAERPVENYLKMPQLKLPNFRDNTENIFSYLNFKSSFLNGVNSFKDMSESTKFIYLKSQLEGRALSLIENLAVDDTSFTEAIALLDKEFLDREEIINKIITIFLNREPVNSLDAACDLVLQLQSQLQDLKKLDYNLEDNEGSLQIISIILRTKLPKFFVTEVSRITDKANPTIKEFYECYQKVRQRLQDRKLTNNAEKKDKSFQRKNAKPENQYVRANVVGGASAVDSGRGNTLPSGTKACKFCNLQNHFSVNCNKFKTFSQRVQRVRELKLCEFCLSPKHEAKDCVGKDNKIPYACKACGLHSHVLPMCKKLAVNTLKD